MKYMLMFCTTDEDRGKWGAIPPAEMQGLYDAVERWQRDNVSRIESGYRLQPVSAATTVRHQDGRVLVTDGPFVEGHEVISGYVIAEVADLDQALAMARTFPACSTVEIRPVLDQ